MTRKEQEPADPGQPEPAARKSLLERLRSGRPLRIAVDPKTGY